MKPMKPESSVYPVVSARSVRAKAMVTGTMKGANTSIVRQKRLKRTHVLSFLKCGWDLKLLGTFTAVNYSIIGIKVNTNKKTSRNAGFFVPTPFRCLILGGSIVSEATMLPRGIEPRSQDPQSCVLSIELREHSIIL